MKKLSLIALAVNFLIALVLSFVAAQFFNIKPVATAVTITAVSAVVQYFAPSLFAGKALMALQTQVWTNDIIENPFPDGSFIKQSKDLSEWVNHDKINLVEAGVEPAVYEDYFNGSETALPLANINDIPHEVVLKTYSTEQTRHRDLQDVELQYDKRSSIIKRHKQALDRNMAIRASFAWTPAASNAFNKVTALTGSDSIIDAIIDVQAFMASLDLTGELNVCLTPDHMAKIRKEDKVLYKDILNENKMYGFNVFQYSKSPLFTSANVKKPMGSAVEAGDKRASFFWASEEVFRALGSVEMYANLRDSAFQADTLSFAQRALIGAMRANSPKYFGAII
ncbi:hypothetical protein ACK2M7_12660 [Chryseobacterium sp. TY4]